MRRSATIGPFRLIRICCSRACRLPLGFQARGVLPRRRAFRRRRCGRLGAWVGSGENNRCGVFPLLSHAHSPEHRGPASCGWWRSVSLHARGARQRSGVCAHGRRAQDRRPGEDGGARSTYTAALCFLRCSGLPPDANVPLLMRRQVRLHLITDGS
jgi:hypothetical protein